MSQKSLRPRFDACTGEGEDEESKRSVELEPVLKAIPDGEGVAGHVLTDSEDSVGGIFGEACCVPFVLGLNKSSRIEVSPMRFARKE